jgi:hypothetical protein
MQPGRLRIVPPRRSAFASAPSRDPSRVFIQLSPRYGHRLRFFDLAAEYEEATRMKVKLPGPAENFKNREDLLLTIHFWMDFWSV